MPIENHYYNYIYKNPIKQDEEFYVGYSGDPERQEDHLNEAKKLIRRKKSNKWIMENCPNPHKAFTLIKILKAGLEPKIDKVFENVTKIEAIDEEIRLIAFYGRADKGMGSLTNMTDGGDGGCHNKIDLIGQKFGRLSVIKISELSEYKMLKWECICECGNKKIINGINLRRGHTKSCGCLQKELFGKRNTTHGKTKTPTYYKWQNLRRNKNYEICERWLKSFENFLEDVGKRPSEKHKLKRIDVNKPFEPTNCLWLK